MHRPGSNDVRPRFHFHIGSFALIGFFTACGQAPPAAPVAPVAVSSPQGPSAAATPSSPRAEGDGGGDGAVSGPLVMDGGELDTGVSSDDAGGGASSCPAGMLLVDTSYCPRVERRCLDEEYSPQNHISICHKFAPTQRCLVEEQHRRFCIDEYEYPNQKGAHPPWMVSWYDAQASCGALGKRLCLESEWVTACEGPAKTPFPYGYSRDNSKCNIDNTWIKPNLAEMYGKDPATRDKELSRLDQSVRSGALAECVSGFGVHDMTGNFDEWVTADRRYDDKSEWAALKGGAWGHVRNACRPTTTSHPPDFTYYFIAFRCCQDAPGGPSEAHGDANPPAVEPANRAPVPDPAYPAGPSATKVAPEKWPKPEVKGR